MHNHKMLQPWMDEKPEMEKDCGCKGNKHNLSHYDGKKKKKLARAFVKEQEFDSVYMADVALKKGTIFPELDQPDFPVKVYNASQSE